MAIDKEYAVKLDDKLHRLYKLIREDTLDFCVQLGTFRRLRLVNYFCSYESFEDYALKEFNLSRSQANKYALVGDFLNDIDPSNAIYLVAKSTDNFENMGITKFYMLARVYFTDMDLFDLLCKENLPGLTANELKAKIDEWGAFKSVGESVEYGGDVKELRDAVETVANDLNGERFLETSANSVEYSDDDKEFVNAVMSLKSETEKILRFVNNNEKFSKCGISCLLAEIISVCDHDLDKYLNGSSSGE